MDNSDLKLYEYIFKSGERYRIIRKGEDYGSFSELSDALYERDRLVKADWNWDDAVQLEETENYYKSMTLPPFLHEYSYITKVAQKFNIYKDNQYYGAFRSKSKAYAFAESIGGEVEETQICYRILKKIDGEQVFFGQFKSLEDAKRERDKLMTNGWVKDDKFIE